MSGRTRSIVWRYFSKKSAKEASCDTCGELVVTSGNTSNLFKVRLWPKNALFEC